MFKQVFKIPIVLIAIALLASCSEHDASLSTKVDKQASKISETRNNPFTAENMQKAIKNVQERTANKKNGRTACSDCIPSTTHNYIRFAPQNVDQLLTLHNYGYDLYDVPLDQEVVTQGEYYMDPSLPPDAITYQYSLVPDNYSLPSTVPYVILNQVFLFDENAGDEADEEDPWIPDPDPGSGYCYDQYGQPYICGTDPRVYLRQNTQLPEDMYKKATQALIDANINLNELYNEAMILAGLEDEVIEISASGRTQSFTPSGTVKVRDNVTGLNVPVKNVTVKTRRWFKIDETQTDANGYFIIGKSYRQKAHVVLKFKNPGMKIRGISGAIKLWEYAQVLEKECGLYESGQNINITMLYQSNPDTYSALQWTTAHALNTYYEAKQFSTSNNITAPYYGMNVWVSSAVTQAASAPMLRALAQTSEISQALNYLLPGTASTIKQIVQNWLPDVTLRIQGGGSTTRNADDVSNTFFHEFGHSQHYSRVGNSYWASEIVYTVANGGYGSKTSSGAERAAVVESWGYFIGNTFNATKYNGINNAIRDRERAQLENNTPVDNVSIQTWGTGSQGWIPIGFPHDLIDTGEPTSTGVMDNVNAYTISGVFNGYNASATTVQTLKTQILNTNAFLQSGSVNTLVLSYRY